MAARGSNQLHVIDGATNQKIATVAVGSYPTGVGVNPVTNHVYTANQLSSNTTVIDGATNGVLGSIGVGATPTDAEIDSVTGHAFVSNQDGASVAVIGPNA